MPLQLTQNQSHRDSSSAALRGEQRAVEHNHKMTDLPIRLFQAPAGDWKIQIGEGRNAFPATDAEVILWKALQQARHELESI